MKLQKCIVKLNLWCYNLSNGINYLEGIMNKKGFTLIELLSVVIIIGIIATVALTSINYTIRRTKEKLFVEQVERIEAGLRSWGLENIDLLPINEEGISFFPITDLKSRGIIDSDEVIDPRTNKPMTGCMIIKFDQSINQYTFRYSQDSCEEASDYYMPIIKFEGGQEHKVEVNTSFKMPGVTATDYKGNKLNVFGPLIRVKGEDEVLKKIDTSIVGTIYEATFRVVDQNLNLTNEKKMQIKVVDTIRPIIFVNESSRSTEFIFEASPNFEILPGVVTDNSCGIDGTDVTVNDCVNTLSYTISGTVMPRVPGNYYLTYRATDSSGNTRTLTLDVLVQDTLPPTTPVFELRNESSTGTLYNGSWTNKNVWLGNVVSNDQGVGIQNYQYSTNCNSDTPTWIDFESSVILSNDINSQICIRAIDYVGNISEASNLRTLRIDKTAPSCSVAGGSSSWFNTDRTITGTCGDAGSGCVTNTISRTYTTNTNTTSASPGEVCDNAGNCTTCENVTVRIDKTFPTCAVSGGSSTWFNTDRTITGTCSDTGGSGCTGNATRTFTETTNGNFSPGDVCDAAGNCTTCDTALVRIDKTFPTCNVTGGSSSWFNTNRTITGTCSDTGGSGCTGNVSRTFTENTNGSFSPGSVCDNAGNCTNCSLATVRIDKTFPTCSVSGGSSSWFNTDRTIIGTCSDTGGSGCTGNSSRTFTTNTNGSFSPGDVCDAAGNCSACGSVTVRIDKTFPTCNTTGSSEEWFNVDRTITGVCSDSGGSGCAGNSTTTYTSNINSTTANPGQVCDNAGNCSPCPNATVKIDKTFPTCSTSGSSSLWFNTDRTITGVCSDTGGSGCVGNSTRTYTENINTTTANPGQVCDRAGNCTSCANATVKIDKNFPTCEVSGGSSTWFNVDRTITGVCSDTGGSGCTGNVTRLFTTNTNGNQSPGTVCDNAGNCTPCGMAMVKIDKTFPTCSVSGGSEDWFNTDRTITGTCSDTGGSGCTGNVNRTFTTNTNANLSPGTVCDVAGNCTSCELALVKIDKTPPTCLTNGGSSSWFGTNRTITGVCSDSGGSGCVGNSSETFTTDTNGSFSPGSVCDNANNCATCPSVTVRVDKTPPTCVTTGGGSEWTNENTTITGTCSDSGSGCAPPIVVTRSFSSNTNGSFPPGSVCDNVSLCTVCPSVLVRLDKSFPTVSLNPSSQSTWGNTNINVVITPSDTGGSGYRRMRTQMSTDDGATYGAWSAYTTSTSLTRTLTGTGNHRINVEVEDIAGNIDVITSSRYRIDQDIPTAPTLNNTSSTWFNTDRTITISGGSAGPSGRARYEYRTRTGGSSTWGSWTEYTGALTYTANTNLEIQARVVDNAGNNGTATATDFIRIDKTNPSVTRDPSSQATWDNSNVVVTLTGTDSGGSGYRRMRTRLSTDDGATYGSWSSYTTSNPITRTLSGTGNHRIEIEVEDHAGNINNIITSRYRIDQDTPTAPTWSGTSSTWYNTDRTISLSGGSGSPSGIARREFRSRTAGGTWGSWTEYTGAITYTVNTNREFQGRVVDNAGNNGTATATAYVRIDKTNPGVTRDPSGQADWGRHNITVTLTGTDSGGSGWRRMRTRMSTDDGATYGSWTSLTTTNPITRTLSGTGNHRIQIETEDNAGNINTITTSRYRIDQDIPTAPSTGGTSSSWQNTDRTFTVSGGSAGPSGRARYEYRTRTAGSDTWGSWTTYSTGITYTSNTNREFQARIIDNAGNTGTATTTRYVRIDKSSPTCSTSGGSTAWTSGNRTLTGTCSDTGGSGCTGNSSRTYSSTINTTTANPGQVCDNAGNCSSCPNATVRIDKTAPSITGIICGYNTSTGRMNIRIDATDAHSGIKQVCIRETSGGVWRCVSSSSTWITWARSNPGGTFYYNARSATDNVDNVASTGSGSCTVVHESS